MKKESVRHFQRFGILGLVSTLIIFGQMSATGLQIIKSKIITTGADDIFEQSLVQPVQFLERIGITPEEIQKQLRVRPRIVVGGAGAVRSLEMASFTSAQPIQTSIQVEGAGAARVVGLAAFTEVPDQPSLKPDIHIVGAGSVRNVGLVAPVGQ
ncbi:MAG: hypothetical protein DYG89_36045 [Caldilinea sp. CFX5]|nr:hypothetical protein [Caldilinea sp. CFX5]